MLGSQTLLLENNWHVGPPLGRDSKTATTPALGAPPGALHKWEQAFLLGQRLGSQPRGCPVARGPHGSQGWGGRLLSQTPWGQPPTALGCLGTLPKALGNPTWGQFQTRSSPRKTLKKGPGLRSGSRAPESISWEQHKPSGQPGTKEAGLDREEDKSVILRPRSPLATVMCFREAGLCRFTHQSR